MQKKSPSNSGSVSFRALVVLLVCAAASLIATGTLPAFLRNEPQANVSQRTLTFAERVAYQRAIEDVYWRHRIWPKERPDPKPSLDAVMSQAQLEKKVSDYLRKSQALEDYWQRPITAEQLQAEMNRMATHTRQPEVLRELFEALGNDPFVIAECLARAALTDRLLTSSYTYDQRIHGALKQRAEAELLTHNTVQQIKQMNGTHSEVEFVKSDGGETPRHAHRLPNEQMAGGAPAAQRQPSTRRVKLNTRQWDETLQKMTAMFADRSVPAGVSPEKGSPTTDVKIGMFSPLQEDESSYYATAVVSKGEDHLKVAAVSWLKEPLQSWLARTDNQFTTAIVTPSGNYTIPAVLEGTGCVDNTWEATAGPPDARDSHTAVWTGSEMIVWGGEVGNSGLNTGSRYNPAIDMWTATSISNAPTARYSHTAVWTGTDMIVWGGVDNNFSGANTGGKYNPGSDTWTPTSISNAPTARSAHTAVWTGSEMIVWGGYNGSNLLNSGGRYNPNTDGWTAMTNVAPEPRRTHTAVWTGSEMIIWGGSSDFNELNTGGRYNAATDTWLATSTTNAPDARNLHTAVWTGSEMIIWGGFNSDLFEDFNTGGRYNPITNSWTATTTTNGPVARDSHTAIWTGGEMIVWGGQDQPFAFNTGGRYSPGSDSWTVTSTTNAPEARSSHRAVWTGSEMIVWGGIGGFPFGGPLNTGGRFNPTTNTWLNTTTANLPSARVNHTAVWTGSEMIIWGGDARGVSLANTGANYTPATDTWMPTSIANAPAGRESHTAIWTGSVMVVWGGSDDFGVLNSGGRYDPGTDTWTATTNVAPEARAGHTAVWSGSEMIIWGGYHDNFVPLNTGGKYNPSADLWLGTSTTNAPAARGYHTAVWANNQMIVWGGFGEGGGTRLNTGGKYDPLTNSWTATSTTNAASARDSHTAVWSDAEMIVWGGVDETNGYPIIGGKYNPITDSWTTTSAIAPEGRGDHTAVWTGSQMIVWGGYNNGDLNTGGRYSPGTDSWTATNPTNAPSSRSRHTAVWTGDEMIVWGGQHGSSVFTSTGGRY